jgi:hypothetical protein
MNPDATRAINTALAAANAGDVDAFLACFEPNGTVDDWGKIYTGQEAIRQWSDREFIGVNVNLHIRAQVTSGDATTVTAEVGGSGFNGPSHFTFEAPGILIHTMRITA